MIAPSPVPMPFVPPELKSGLASSCKTTGGGMFGLGSGRRTAEAVSELMQRVCPRPAGAELAREHLGGHNLRWSGPFVAQVSYFTTIRGG